MSETQERIRTYRDGSVVHESVSWKRGEQLLAEYQAKGMRATRIMRVGTGTRYDVTAVIRKARA